MNACSSLQQLPGRPVTYLLQLHDSCNAQVVNTGNVDLWDVTVWNTSIPDDCGVVEQLVPRGSFSCSGVYELTWLDINSGRVENVVQ